MSRTLRNVNMKRDWGSDDSQTPILHVDMDAFFVSAELLRNPQLRGKPVAVGGGERGVVAAASYEARRFGVNSALPLFRAVRQCPDLIILPVDMRFYRELSRQIMDIFSQFTPAVEQISVDEAFLDVRSAGKLFGSPRDIAVSLRRRIKREVGVPASVGIANTKHLAKLASAYAKPDGMLLIPAHRSHDFLNELSVGDLWGIGGRSAEKLARFGITSVPDVLAAPARQLQKILGTALGGKVLALAENKDCREVVPRKCEKSIGKEHTFARDTDSVPEILSAILAESHFLGHRLRSRNMYASAVGIKVKFADFTCVTRSAAAAVPGFSGADIYRSAVSLFDRLLPLKQKVRLVGVKAERLTGAASEFQPALDADDRSGRIESALDEVRRKFGAKSAGFATLYGEDGKNTGFAF